MSKFYLRVERPENRHIWEFFESDAENAEKAVTISIPKRRWTPQEVFDKNNKLIQDAAEKGDEGESLTTHDLMMEILKHSDPEGAKWLTTNKKRIPYGQILEQMWNEWSATEGPSEGESETSRDS